MARAKLDKTEEKPGIDKTTKVIFILVMIAILFAFFYGMQGNTAQFLAASQTLPPPPPLV